MVRDGSQMLWQKARGVALVLTAVALGGCALMPGAPPDRIPPVMDDEAVLEIVDFLHAELPRWFGGSACLGPTEGGAGGKTATAYLAGGWVAQASVTRMGQDLRLAVNLSRSGQAGSMHVDWSTAGVGTVVGTGPGSRRVAAGEELADRLTALAERLWGSGCR